jgi:hypothetical protein
MCSSISVKSSTAIGQGKINDSFRLLRSGAAPNFEGGVASFLWKSKFQQLVINGPFKSQALDRY